MLCYVMLCYVMLCYVMLCYVMLCYVMLCYVMLCRYVMLCLCYVMLWYVMFIFIMQRLSIKFDHSPLIRSNLYASMVAGLTGFHCKMSQSDS